MVRNTQYTRQEFELHYTAMKNTASLNQNMTRRPGYLGDLVGKIIDRQSYEISALVAQNVKYNYDKIIALDPSINRGKKLTIRQIRAGELDWEGVQDLYWQLRQSGMTGKDTNRLIGISVFGSE